LSVLGPMHAATYPTPAREAHTRAAEGLARPTMTARAARSLSASVQAAGSVVYTFMRVTAKPRAASPSSTSLGAMAEAG
jgi:hypothetical protein